MISVPSLASDKSGAEWREMIAELKSSESAGDISPVATG